MKNKIYLLYWLLAFLSVGCYDDKGNNDYRFVNTIEVEPFGQDSYPWAALGDIQQSEIAPDRFSL